jgi:phage replication-related protein YjqB (UPF0714/DUF867 family)
MVVTIHGCAEQDAAVLLGGLNIPFVCRIEDALSMAGFQVDTRDGLQGLHPENLCNLGKRGGGIQLELSSGLREAMFLDLTRAGRRRTTNIFCRFVAILTATLQGIEDSDDLGESC